MKQCTNPDCGQTFGETIDTCPSCGHPVASDMESIDGYTIFEMVGQTSSVVCYKAQRQEDGQDVMLRVYPAATQFSNNEADLINKELQAVSALSKGLMSQHFDLNKTAAGRWYRVSEWVEVTAWGDLMASRFFRDPRKKRAWIDLFIRIAETLKALHDSGRIMPHLSLNDLLLYKDQQGLQVKLDYKLRFFENAVSQQTGIARHLNTHPDFKAERALDLRSDIWTFGCLMVELLTGTDEIDDCQKTMDEIYQHYKPVVLHRKLSGLLRTMVEDDPDKRPSSMDHVLASLCAVTDDDIAKWRAFEKDPSKKKKLRKSIVYATGVAACIVVLFFGVFSYYQRQQSQKQIEAVTTQTQAQVRHSQDEVAALKKRIEGEKKYIEGTIAEQLSQALKSMEGKLPEEKMTLLADKYRHSVAFVLAEYYLEYNGEKSKSAMSSGSAFLVSSDGYLLTNRHVACPWLMDQRIAELFKKVREKEGGSNLKLKHNLYLWFDGVPAFRTVAGLNSNNIEDRFILSTAYQTRDTGDKNLKIMGVMPEPLDLKEKLYSLEDDVAVLKVASLPSGAVPIPLQTYDTTKKVIKGTSVFAMGFPHGRDSIMGTKAVSRITDGTITRLFDNVLTTNANIHPGNSGGPVINMDGFAVGIASAAFGGSDDKSSMGRVYPIEKARIFLDKVRMGRPQWKGMPTFTFEGELEKAVTAALSGKQSVAGQIIKTLIQDSPHPDLYFWAGIVSSQGDTLSEQGVADLKENISLDPENAFAKYLLYRDDYLTDVPLEKRAFRKDLVSLSWWDHSEILKYMVQMLEGKIPVDRAMLVGDTPDESALLYWAAASTIQKEDRKNRIRLLKKANESVSQGSALQFLVNAELAGLGVSMLKGATVSSIEKAGDFEGDLDAVLNKLLKEVLDPKPSSPSLERRQLIIDIFELTNTGRWQQALDKIEAYFNMPNRESANMLGLGLLRCQLLFLVDYEQEAIAALNAYRRQIQTPWYRRIAACLLGEVAEKELILEALQQPEKILTLATAMGLKYEAEGDLTKAVDKYNDALDTGMVDWAEFSLAVERRKHIRGLLP